MQLYMLYRAPLKTFPGCVGTAFCFTTTTQLLVLMPIELNWKCYPQNLGGSFSGALYANFNIAPWVESYPSRQSVDDKGIVPLLDEVAQKTESCNVRPHRKRGSCLLASKECKCRGAVCTSDPWENALTRPSIHACLSSLVPRESCDISVNF